MMDNGHVYEDKVKKTYSIIFDIRILIKFEQIFVQSGWCSSAASRNSVADL